MLQEKLLSTRLSITGTNKNLEEGFKSWRSPLRATYANETDPVINHTHPCEYAGVPA